MYRTPIALLLLLFLGTNLFAQQRSFDDDQSNPFADVNQFTVWLKVIPDSDWCFPLPGAKVLSTYAEGRGRNHRHSGVDLKTFAGDSIRAAFDGNVILSKPVSGYGNCIVIRHAYGIKTLYAHNVRNLVKKGDFVRVGQVVALTGRTGRATTEHLHFEVRVAGYHYDPSILFDFSTQQLKKHKLVFKRNGRVKTKR